MRTTRLFGFYYLDLDSVTLISNLELDVTKMYQYTKHEVCRSKHSKFITVHADAMFLLVKR